MHVRTQQHAHGRALARPPTSRRPPAHVTNMASKRQRLVNNSWLGTYSYERAGSGVALAGLGEDMESYGKQLHDYLIGRHVSGKMPSSEICLIAHLITKAGGCGVDLIAL